MQLNNDQKQQIRAEELFRLEVQRELARETTKNDSWLSGLFESTRSRFIATAFVIPLFLWMYAYFQAEITSSRQEAAYVDRVEKEIRERLIGHADGFKASSPRVFNDINESYLYPEFEGWGMSVLLLELSEKNDSLPWQPLELMKQGFRESDASQILEAGQSLGWLQR